MRTRPLPSVPAALLAWLLLLPWLCQGCGGEAVAQPAYVPTKSVALVVGNGAYANPAHRLENPKRDAVAVAAALRDVGFEVVEAIDLGTIGFKAAIDQFIGRLGGADVALLYYAGHGVQIDGRNFIVPVDAPLTDFPRFRSGVVASDEIVARMDKAAPATAAKIVMLDACRDNPFAGLVQAGTGQASRGLARAVAPATDAEREKEAGSAGYFRILAFATAAGDVASDGGGVHSPYTRSLLRFIRQPGLEISEMFRLIAADVLEETRGVQKPEYLMQISRALFFKAPYATECDRLAAEAQNFVGVPGRPFLDVDPAKAVPACEQALRDLPDSPRIAHNLGRAYERARRLEDAFRMYGQAASAGYPQALGALGIAYLAGCGVPKPEVERGVKLIAQARELGNLGARRTMTAHDMLRAMRPPALQMLQGALAKRGLYKAGIDGQDRPELRAALSAFQSSAGLVDKGFTLETAHALGLYDAVPLGFNCH